MAARITPSVRRTPAPADAVHAEQRQKLAHEPVEPGKPDARQAGEDHRVEINGSCEANPAELADFARVIAFVNHADQEEQRPGRQAVVDHLQKAARHSLGIEGEHAQHAEARDG